MPAFELPLQGSNLDSSDPECDAPGGTRRRARTGNDLDTPRVSVADTSSRVPAGGVHDISHDTSEHQAAALVDRDERDVAVDEPHVSDNPALAREVR